MKYDLIALDADDTLWNNETLYHASQSRFREILAPFASDEEIDRALFATEMSNLPTYGYGIKAFTLSMIETAIKLSDGNIDGDSIREILGIGKRMLTADVVLLDGVDETLHVLAGHFPLLLVTKGDLLDQESKLSRSGLRDLFRGVEIVSEKDQQTYRGMLDRLAIAPDRFLMVGNSLRSDVLPVVAIGGHAVHIPFHLTWEHESTVPEGTTQDGWVRLDSIGELPAFLGVASPIS